MQKLTEQYYKLISKDHHKDRDCHFYINKVYSYGQKPYYRFEHYGYCWTIEEFFKEKENQQLYFTYIEEKANAHNFFKTAYFEENGIKNYIMPQNEKVLITEFPKRETLKEAEKDMKTFLEWAIKEEKKC